MTLAEMIAALDYELQDTGTLWSDAERTRAIQKTVNLMSRLIPKRSVVEGIITRTISSEALTIASSTGTLAHKPIKKGSLTITGEVEGTDYTVNYRTGVVTEVGSLLADGAYTANYELDSQMYNLSEVSLTDYIKIESIEYPVGDTPISKPTFDVIDGFIVLRGSEVFTEDDHIRITYLKKWTAPATAAGDYPTHLDDIVIIGSAGQCLIYKAELYVQSAVTILTAVTAPTNYTITKPTSPTLSTVPTVYTIVKPTTPTFPSAPTPPTLSTLTPPSAYTISKPTSPTLPTAPTAPTAPTPSYTAAELAMTAIGDAITAAIAYLTTGATYLSAFSWDEKAVADLGSHAAVAMEAAGHRVNEAIARLRQIEEALTLYASQVTSYGSAVNAYANAINGVIGKYREDINNEIAGINNVTASTQIYVAEIQEDGNLLSKYQQDVNQYAAQTAALVNKFQAEIQNELLGINNYSAQVNLYLAQVNALVSKFQAEIQNETLGINNFQAQVQKYSSQVASQEAVARGFLDVAGRYLASGQAKIGEFYAALGIKPEFVTQRAMSEQRS